MKILNLVQGSDEWLEARLNYFCASEAPAMMGDSKFMSRNQLLDLKKGWQTNPDSSFKKKIFSKGHEHEDSAREITELEYCDEFSPAVALRHIGGLELLASFDGYSGTAAWEHKDWNATLAENVRNGIIEPHYYWQLEHQAFVAGLDQVIFTCSDGTAENRVSMIYQSVPERRKQLIAGWKQFAEDLRNHELKAKEVAVVLTATQLPAVTYSVTGTEIATNIGDCLSAVKELAEIEMSRVLESDQDFANKEQLNKDVKKARAALKEITANVRGEFVSYSQFESIAAELDGVLQKMQSHGEKQVKEAKEEKKKAIADDAMCELHGLATKCNMTIAPLAIGSIIDISPDFTGAMKNKRTIESLEAAVSEELAKWKVEINQAMDRIVPNLEYLSEHAGKFRYLFPDVTKMINQDAEPFQAIVKSRIAEHKQAGEERLKVERERIEREAEEKAQREAKAKAEIEREKIRTEERAKAEAETAKPAEQAAPEKPQTLVQEALQNEVYSPTFVYSELRARLSSDDDVNLLCNFFECSDIDGIEFGSNGERYNLEVIICRVSLKGGDHE